MPGSPMARTIYHPDFAGKILYPATWRELEWLAKRSTMPLVVKGEHLRVELARAMQLSGTASLAEATPDLLAPV